MFGARINMEHIKGYAADSTFRRFGDVTKAEAEEITDGKLKGKLALFGYIDPTPELVELTKARQKIYTSVEVNPKFADTGEAYLIGLAVTDDPASLGTEYLSFSATAKANPLASRKLDKDNLFTAAEETLIEFYEEADPGPSLRDRIAALFSAKKKADDVQSADVHAAVTLVAEQLTATGQEAADALSALDRKFSERLDALQLETTTGRSELESLTSKLEKTDGNFNQRPRANGGDKTSVQTDC